MSKTKSPRRAYDHKRVENARKSRQAAAAKAAEMSAFYAAGLARPNIVKAMMQLRASLDAITHGQGSMQHAEQIAMASNMAMTLCEMGLGSDDDLEVAKDARDALIAMGQRRIDTGRWGLKGPELLAVRAMLDLRDAQLESEDNTCGLEITAAMEVDKRIAEGNVVRVLEIVASHEAVAA